MQSRVAFTAIICLLINSPVPAQQARPQADAIGIGTTTCSTFRAHSGADLNPTQNFYFAWAQGFMTGRNMVLSDPKVQSSDYPRNLNAQNVVDQMYLLYSHCVISPSRTYASIVLDLYKTLPRLEVNK
jgi:hypothetical protein